MNLQLFGGRGGSLGLKKGGKRPAVKGSNWKPIQVPKLSSAALAQLKRPQLLKIAKAVYVNANVKLGLSPAEAARRFDLLQDGNTTAQLRKYIKKNNR